ncbi:MAG: indole-3-glycerol-phosphate synthase [Microbacteriaceae bacterium]|nr:indole-3-glycerol-phosphate synthase [Microbacteriaceae bacterium]
MLSALTQGALADALARKQQITESELLDKIAQQAPALDVFQHFKSLKSVGVIAEIKRASPSKGELAEIANPLELAEKYALAGASAISVLTEERKFKGSLADLTAVSAAVTLPTLRKDFISVEYQILEARAAGASFFLLIVAALDDSTLSRLLEFGRSLGMEALVETHDETELERAIAIGAKIIGINARNLSTFELDREIFGRLRNRIPSEAVAVAESAVLGTEDMLRYVDAGADLVLIGEALVKNDPVATLREFLAAGLGRENK